MKTTLKEEQTESIRLGMIRLDKLAEQIDNAEVSEKAADLHIKLVVAKIRAWQVRLNCAQACNQRPSASMQEELA